MKCEGLKHACICYRKKGENKTKLTKDYPSIAKGMRKGEVNVFVWFTLLPSFPVNLVNIYIVIAFSRS